METERTGVRVVVEDGQQYIKTEVLKHLDQIAKAMLEKAKAGGTTQLRLLWALGKLDEDATADVNRRSPSFSALLMQEIALKQAAKKRAGE